MMHVKMLYADPDEHPDENRTFMRDFAGGGFGATKRNSLASRPKMGEQPFSFGAIKTFCPV